MIAFVEKRMEPVNAMINPVMGIAALVDLTFIFIVRTQCLILLGRVVKQLRYGNTHIESTAVG